MPSFATVANAAVVQAQDVNQLVNALNGAAGLGVPLAVTAVNDSVNFALVLKNGETTNSRALQVLRANNVVLLQADANGVVGSVDGVAAAAQLVNVSLAQTLTNKTLTSPLITTLQVSSGGIGVGAAPVGGVGVATGGTAFTQGYQVGGSLTSAGNNSNLYGFNAAPSLAAGGFTGNTYAAFQVPATAAPAGFISNYGLLIGAPTGASTQNFAVKAAGTSLFGSASAATGIILDSGAGVAPTAGASQIALGSGIGTTATAGTNGAPPAQVAGYWFINVAGTIQKVPYYNN